MQPLLTPTQANKLAEQLGLDKGEFNSKEWLNAFKTLACRLCGLIPKQADNLVEHLGLDKDEFKSDEWLNAFRTLACGQNKHDPKKDECPCRTCKLTSMTQERNDDVVV